jgi:hypothetical protein
MVVSNRPGATPAMETANEFYCQFETKGLVTDWELALFRLADSGSHRLTSLSGQM